jgi:hypothetical protein
VAFYNALRVRCLYARPRPHRLTGRSTVPPEDLRIDRDPLWSWLSAQDEIGGGAR